ncbi:hypothetical protein ACQPX6_06835 [Actinomycetospora sp. CA-101289]|uniref:hypothetical protein n=1 Tax=Actinomycetospora sp. CA-101289 TaxID=3239893 RepID=UPI003D95BFBD
MDAHQHLADQLIERLTELDACDGYVVVVRDAQTGETDAHGPFEDGLDALRAAERTRLEFDLDEVEDIQITITRLHLPAGRPALAASSTPSGTPPAW